MSKLFGFDCPACGMYHEIRIGTDNHPCWNWDGNEEKPTFTPSVNVQWSWHDQIKNVPVEKKCHFFISNGTLMFCGDCSHGFAGECLPLPEGLWYEIG